MTSKYNYDIIRDYLHGLTDRETSLRIRELIRTDEVARNIASGILQLEHDFNGNEEEIDKYLDDLLQKQFKLVNHSSNRGWIRMAAAILAIALVGSVVWLTVGNEDVLEKELKEPYPFSASRGSTEDEGYDLYLKRDYKNAIVAFDKIPSDATATFYNGLSHLYAGEYNDAISLFGLLESSRYQQQAFWFKTLALIKVERKNEARKNLEEMSADPDHFKSSEARELLEQLEP